MSRPRILAFLLVTLLRPVGAGLADDENGPAPDRPADLQKAIDWLAPLQARLEQINDYEAMFVFREEVNGELRVMHHIQQQVRHKPFSTHWRWLKPADGQEMWYLEGRNDDKALFYSGPLHHHLKRPLPLDPRGSLALRFSRYPLTDKHIRGTLARTLQYIQRPEVNGELELKTFEGAKINGRLSPCLQLAHKHDEHGFLLRVFKDDELDIPVRFELYDTTGQMDGEKPRLLEEYTWLDVKLNNGFDDETFTPDKPRVVPVRQPGEAETDEPASPSDIETGPLTVQKPPVQKAVSPVRYPCRRGLLRRR